LIQGTDGNFYGTTSFGGLGFGTVFKITPAGTLTTLYSFCSQAGCPDGDSPQARLVQGTDGSFYGSTVYGGSNATNGGTVFKITPFGQLTTLYSFCSQTDCADGSQPLEALIQASDGNFYGVTDGGGGSTSCTYGCGTVFKITPAGILTTLHAFSSGDGSFPTGLVQGTDGNLYGTTNEGGTSTACAYGCGVIFSISTSGVFGATVSFEYTDGAFPYHGGLVQDTNGRFYGTTAGGGADTSCSFYVSGCGTVFSFAEAGLGPFVKTEPTSGKVGAPVKILGTNLTGATSVTFNGIAATIISNSASLITTTVPTGATTGHVQVTTPHGTLKSNVVFRVRPSSE